MGPQLQYVRVMYSIDLVLLFAAYVWLKVPLLILLSILSEYCQHFITMGYSNTYSSNMIELQFAVLFL